MTFIDGLIANGPAAERTEKLMLYGQFVGDWITETVEHRSDDTEVHTEWDIGFARVLEARAIQDLWTTPAAGFHFVAAYGMMTIMRFPREHKAQVRERIIHAAAEKLRGDGLDGPSVPDLMREAGLTHGGFYGYFRSRDELLTEAVRHAAAETAQGLFRASPDLSAVLNAYLSEEHLRRPEAGCVVAALGSEGWRKGKKVRAAFADVGEGLARLVDEKLGAKGNGISDRALAVTAQMIGAVVLGRVVADPKLAGRIVSVCREAALQM